MLERIAHGTDGYAPGTLAPGAEIVFTPSNDPVQDAAVAVRARAVKTALDNGSHLQEPGATIAIGRIAYYLYVLSCVAVILAASVPAGAGSRRNLWTVLKNAGTLLYDAVTAQWSPLLAALERLVTDPNLIGTLLAGFAVAGLPRLLRRSQTQPGVLALLARRPPEPAQRAQERAIRLARRPIKKGRPKPPLFHQCRENYFGSSTMLSVGPAPSFGRGSVLGPEAFNILLMSVFDGIRKPRKLDCISSQFCGPQ